MVSKDVKFTCAFFDLCEKIVGRCQPTQKPTQKFKNWIFDPQVPGIGSGLVSFEIIFEALESKLFRFRFRPLSYKIKNPGIRPNDSLNLLFDLTFENLDFAFVSMIFSLWSICESLRIMTLVLKVVIQQWIGLEESWYHSIILFRLQLSRLQVQGHVFYSI